MLCVEEESWRGASVVKDINISIALMAIKESQATIPAQISELRGEVSAVNRTNTTDILREQCRGSAVSQAGRMRRCWLL